MLVASPTWAWPDRPRRAAHRLALGIVILPSREASTSTASSPASRWRCQRGAGPSIRVPPAGGIRGSRCRGARRLANGRFLRAASRSPPAHRPDLDRQRYQVVRWKPSVPDREQGASQEEALPGVSARSRSPITDAPTSPIVKSAARCAEGINDPYCRAAVHKPLRCCRFQRSSTSSEELALMADVVAVPMVSDGILGRGGLWSELPRLRNTSSVDPCTHAVRTAQA